MFSSKVLGFEKKIPRSLNEREPYASEELPLFSETEEVGLDTGREHWKLEENEPSRNFAEK